MSLRIMRGERVAGPMVQTILECREFIRPPIVCDVSPILKTELKKQILRAKYTQDDHWRAAGLKTERTAAIEAYRLTENPATMRVMRSTPLAKEAKGMRSLSPCTRRSSSSVRGNG